MKTIKERILLALLNPIYIFEYILGVEIPNQKKPYTTAKFVYLQDMLDLLMNESYLNVIENIINSNLDEDLDELIESKVHKDSDIIILFNGLMKYKNGKIKHEIIEMYRDIFNVEDVDEIDSDAFDVLMEYKYRASDFNYDYNKVIKEFGDRNLEALSNQYELLDSLIHYISSIGEYDEEDDYMPISLGELYKEKQAKDPMNDKIVMDVKQKEINEREKVMLYKEVNKLDKSHGLKLKKHDKHIIDSIEELNEQIDIYKIGLAKMLFILNNIDKHNFKSYKYILKEEVNELKIDKQFKKASSWFDGESYSLNDIRYKSRFLTHLLRFVIVNLDVMVERYYEFVDSGDYKFVEENLKSGYVDTIVYNTANIVALMLDDEPYTDELLELIQISMLFCTDSRKKYLRKVDQFYRDSLSIKTELRRLFKNQSATFDCMLNLSYMLCANNHKLGKMTVDKDYKFKDVDVTETKIRKLGKEIINSKNDGGINELFKLFIKSDPEVYCRWDYVNEDIYLMIGMEAISYMTFVLNDEKVTNTVIKMTCR